MRIGLGVGVSRHCYGQKRSGVCGRESGCETGSASVHGSHRSRIP